MTSVPESSDLRSWLFLLALLSVLVAPAPASAQIVDRIGVKGGLVSTSATDGRDLLDPERRTGWSAHLFAERDLSSFLSVVGEAGYTQRGFVETIEERGPDGTVEQTSRANTRLDYLTIPVFAKLKYEFTALRLYALAGPRLDVLVGREAGVFEFESAPVDQVKSDLASIYTSPVLGATFGLGVSTSKGLPLRLMLEARWALDVTESSTGVPRDVRNNAGMVMIGIGF